MTICIETKFSVGDTVKVKYADHYEDGEHGIYAGACFVIDAVKVSCRRGQYPDEHIEYFGMVAKNTSWRFLGDQLVTIEPIQGRLSYALEIGDVVIIEDARWVVIDAEDKFEMLQPNYMGGRSEKGPTTRRMIVRPEAGGEDGALTQTERQGYAVVGHRRVSTVIEDQP